MEWGSSAEFFATPAGLVAIAVASLLLTALFLYVVGGVVYATSRWVVPRARWANGKLTPDGPAGVLAALLVFAVVIVFGFAGPLSGGVGTFGEGTSGPAAATTSGFLDQAFEDGKVIRAEEEVVYVEPAGYDRPEPDTAGDRLRDEWLRAGETPGGAPLPDGSAERLDLYVYVVHGSNVEPLSAREKQQLREVWAGMPVENPDNSTGIDLHVESGGSLDHPVTFDGDVDPTRHYDSALPPSHRCRYHLVVLGEPTTRTVGRATSPGYGSFVTGVRDPDYPGNVTSTVSVATHELLHNVVGRMDDPRLPGDGGHTRSGWLAPTVNGEEFLSQPTADHLNESRFSGSGLYQNDICPDRG